VRKIISSTLNLIQKKIKEIKRASWILKDSRNDNPIKIYMK
jgi:hypothetical protein